MEDPIVSVCMITYNHESYIREAIEGVLMQKTSFPIELIIGEDCSTDNTRKIVREYEERYPEIIKAQYPEKNRGMMNNFLTVLQSACGKYIALCEGDDYWIDPLKLQKQVDFLEKNPEYSLVFHNYYILQNNKLTLRDIRLKPTLYQHDYAKVLSGVHTLTVVFRNILNANDYNHIFGSYFLFLKIADNGPFRFMKDPMAVYRIHDGGIYSGKSFFDQYKMSLENKALMIDAYRYNKRLCNKLKNTYVNFSIFYAFALFKRKYFRHGLFYLRKSFNYGFRITHIIFFPNYFMKKIKK